MSGVRRFVLVSVFFSMTGLLLAQVPSASEQQEYQAAVAKPRGPEQVSALERFAASHPQSRLKIDALELLVWNSRMSANLADLEYWTGQLLSVAPENPLAAAVIIGDSLNISSENRVSYAKRTLPAIERFDRPEGMSHEDFAAMRNFVSGTLNGVVGYSYFERKDFNSARPYLRNAVGIDPHNAQYTYTLALCDLLSSNPDQAEGYTMLARAVNLTKGTAAGERLSAFARQNFQQAGGSSENWDKYLAATIPPPLPVPAEQPEVSASTSVPAAAAPGAIASNVRPPTATGSAPTTTASSPASVSPSSATPSGGGGIGTSPTRSASTTTPASSATSIASATRPVAPTSEAILVASNTASPALPNGAPVTPPPSAAAAPPPPAPSPNSERPLRVFPPRPAKHIAPGSPLSVGVLIQASLANPANRKPVVFTLSDLVRHLRDKDEAFIMSFSRGVVFQEDLTSNSKSLENAMDEIAPTPGAAMYDAVTFAAGHLDRVARNPNRILLVIAAEGDRDSTVSPLELSSEINLSGVTIYCIGVGLATPTDQNRLEALADSTGGRAIFIPDLSRFRDATRSIAQGLGIAFQ